MTKTSESYGEFSTFPTKLRKLMEERKVTNKKLSEICSVKAQSVSQWAHGETRPDILSLVKIAEFFNVSTDYLLREGDIKTTDLTTKEMCNKLGLSEMAIGILLRSDDYTNKITKIHKEMERIYPSIKYSETSVTVDAVNYSCMLREGINCLVDDFDLSLRDSILDGCENPHRLSFIELISNFFDCIDARGLDCDFVMLDSQEGKETRVKIPLAEGFIDGYTTYGKPTSRFANMRKLLIEASINDIVAKLHDIKSDVLKLHKEAYESEEETK